MKYILETLWTEYLKIRRSKMLLITILIFIFIPFMMSLLFFVQKYPEVSGKLGMIGTKSNMLRLGKPDWTNYFGLLTQGIAGIGLMGFGFVASWVFGREYSDHTVKDILALPVSRSLIVLSKFIIVAVWSILLTLVFFVFGLVAGQLIGISGWSAQMMYQSAVKFSEVSLLSILLCTPVAFFASYGRGYLLPMAFVIITLIMANFTGLVGLGPYFPWAIPGIFSAPAGTEGMILGTFSYIILFFTFILGLIGTLAWWRYADQH